MEWIVLSVSMTSMKRISALSVQGTGKMRLHRLHLHGMRGQKKNHKGRDKKSYFTQLKNRGLQIQYGKTVGKHDLLTTWTYDKSRYYDTHVRKKTTSSVERESVLGYVQDKIHITDRWEITPALRYSYYSDFAKFPKQEFMPMPGNLFLLLRLLLSRNLRLMIPRAYMPGGLRCTGRSV